jgi:diguanylate cyclase (GGDEF)-like protein/PAS domain S-box-containing protein
MRARIAALTSGFIYSYHRQLFSGIAKAAEAFDVDLVGIPCGPANIRNDELGMRNILYSIIDPAQYDGFLVPYSSLGQYCGYEEFRRMLAPVFDRPSVAIGGLLEGHPSVVPDDYSGVYELFLHLIRGHGCKSFLFIRGEPKHFSSNKREEAARAALAACGLAAEGLKTLQGQLNAEGAGEAMDRLLHEGGLDGLDAIVAVSDTLAIAAMRRLQERGLRVPEDIVVCGTSGYEDSESCSPPLTTVDVEVERNGFEAMRTLLDLIRDGKAPELTVIGSNLRIRASCGCVSSERRSRNDRDLEETTHSYLNLFREFGYSLITRTDYSELFHLMNRYLGTKNIFLSLFEHGGAPFSRSSLVAAFSDGSMRPESDEGRAFRSGELLPRDLLPEGRSTLVVQPLYYGREQLGLLAMDFEPRHGLAYEAIAAQVAGALNSRIQGDRVKEAEGRFHEMAVISSDWLWEIDAEGILAYTSDGAERLMGFSRQELAGKDFLGLFFPDDPTAREGLRHALLVAGEPIRDREASSRAKDGKTLFLQLSGTPMRGKDHAFKGFRGACRDVTAGKRSEERIQALAFYDPLTKLPNRRLLESRLETLILANRREEALFAVMFIDLDSFKSVNDSLGHDAGDELLRRTAAALSSCIREGDTLARVGGDEFIILLLRIKDVEEARPIADRIVEQLSSRVGPKGLGVTSSIGVALYPRDGVEGHELLKNADLAMYAAKRAGKNRYCFYRSDMRLRP